MLRNDVWMTKFCTSFILPNSHVLLQLFIYTTHWTCLLRTILNCKKCQLHVLIAWTQDFESRVQTLNVANLTSDSESILWKIMISLMHFVQQCYHSDIHNWHPSIAIHVPMLTCSQGYHKDKAFLATQGPLVVTTDDFWRMVFEEKSASIVMLAQQREGGKVNECRDSN